MKPSQIVPICALIGLIIDCLVIPWLLLNWYEVIGWQPLPTPPEQVAEIVSYEDIANTIIVRTVSNRLYTCTFSRKSIFSHGCLPQEQPVSTPHSPTPPFSNLCRGKGFPTPKPPGAIAEELEAHPCIAEGYSQVNVILLENGTLWGWSAAKTDLDMGFALLCAPVSGGVGIVLGGLLGLNLRRFARWNNKPTKSQTP
jgi:hypothetical protein